MLQPKKTKFRRQQKGSQKGNAQRGNQLAFGSFGIKSLETKWITGRQIEAARIAVTRYMQRQGQIWIRIFPDKPITRKPADVRMGKGKGAPEGFVAPVTPGRIIIEAEGVPYEVAKEALRRRRSGRAILKPSRHLPFSYVRTSAGGSKDFWPGGGGEGAVISAQSSGSRCT